MSDCFLLFRVELMGLIDTSIHPELLPEKSKLRNAKIKMEKEAEDEADES